MPADTQYDEVHERTKGSERYDHCQNKVRKPSYWAPHRRVFPDGSFEIISVRIPDTLSKACRNFFLWDDDPKCEGCTYPKDTEYAERMKGMT